VTAAQPGRPGGGTAALATAARCGTIAFVPRWNPPAGDMRVPGLVVDTDVLDRNLRAMADSAARRGLALRPHAKTHKSPEVARRQVGFGAVGLSVATVSEAGAFAAAGFGDLFIAYPVWAGGDRAGRLAELARRTRLSVGADSAAAAAQLAAAVGTAPVRVLVEVDCGLRRSGVPPAEAGMVAAAAAGAGLDVAGVFTFPGHSYAPGAPAPAAADEARALAAAARSLAAAGLPCPVRSGGSTPSAPLAAAAGTPPADGSVTELRPGVYAFNDAQQVVLGTCTLDEVALVAVATVVSVPAAGRFVLDAGSKILGPERPAWAPGHGLLPAFPGWQITGLWEHHAVATVPAGGPPQAAGGTEGPVAPPPQVGDQVIVIPNHVCTVVNLASELNAASGGKLTGRWPVAARGLND
jgi:D-serine deaminase-like pyridoxal phosphate-dependent protein